MLLCSCNQDDFVNQEMLEEKENHITDIESNLNKLDETIDSKKILVNCIHGHSRSASIII